MKKRENREIGQLGIRMSGFGSCYTNTAETGVRLESECALARNLSHEHSRSWCQFELGMCV